MSSLVLESRYDGVKLELTPTAHPFDGDFAELPTWEARLAANGLEAVLVCPESDARRTLADYFDELYEARLGWDGECGWSSQANGMALTATHDQINTVHMKLALEGGGIEPRWRTVADFYLDPGVFHRLAENARLYGEASLPSPG